MENQDHDSFSFRNTFKNTNNRNKLFCQTHFGIKYNMYNQIQVRFLKKYSAEINALLFLMNNEIINALKTVQFPNYNIFSNVDVAYCDLLNKISNTIDNVAPIKETRIKDNTPEWFDNEIAEAIKIRAKYFKKFKKSNLQID